jgi:hypothetical protein
MLLMLQLLQTNYFDITDISNQKVRFRVAFVNAGTQTTGSTTRDFTSMRFIRLGDT